MQHPVAIDQAKPGVGIEALQVKRPLFALGKDRANGTGDGDQEQQHDGEPQIGEQCSQATKQGHGGDQVQRARRVSMPVQTSTTPLIGGTQRPIGRRASNLGTLAAALPAISKGST